MHLIQALAAVAAVGSHVAAMSDRGLQAEPHRVLRAATKRADLYRRSVRITRRFESEMAYVDHENVWSDASIFASQVKVGSQKPVLNLEEHEHHLQAVKCDQNAMKLHFVDTSSARDARAACEGETGGLIITSHEGCNEEGERSVYRVNDVSFAEDGEALEVSVMKTTWREAFDHVNVTFGHTTDDHIYRRHSDFARIRGKRQNRVEIPQNAPDNVNTARFDLNSEVVDKTFISTDFLDIIGGIAPIPDLPVNIPIELGCKRCATTGQLALSQGAFNIDLSQIDLIPDIFEGGDDGKEISSVVTGGFMELVATGVGARLELFARPSGNGAFEVALFQLPIAGFTIPGIGKAGAVFEPRVNFQFEVTGGLELNYGLELKVPDGSSIRVELTNLGGSKLTGFQDTSLTPLPVTVNITDVDILLGLAFKPSIPVGFEFLDQFKAEVSATLELPRLDAKLSSNIAANCGNGTNVTVPTPPPPPPAAPPVPPFTNSTVRRRQNPIQLGPLALVEANVSISCDLAFDVSLPVLPPPFNAVSVSQNVFKAEFPLISECTSPERAFDESAGVIIPAPPSSASETSAPVANATATPENTAPVLNITTSAVVTDSVATSTSVSLSTPSFQNVSASVTSPSFSAPSSLNATTSFSAPSPLNATTSFSAPSPLNTTTASSSAAAFLNTTTTSSSASLPLNTTAPSISAPSFLNTTTTLSSSTALVSSSIRLNTTAASNLTTPTTSTFSANLSTTILTATSSLTSEIPITTVTPSANTTTLDPNFSFSLFSTSRRTRASSTDAVKTSTSEVKSSAEATSTPESSPSSTSSEINTSVEATSTQESSSTSSALGTDTSSTESVAASASSTPASSSTPVSSTSSSIAPSTSISTQPAASPTLAIPAQPPFPTEALQGLAATLSVAAGFLMPTNASALPAVQTTVQTFTGIAARDVNLPSIASLLGPLAVFIGVWMI